MTGSSFPFPFQCTPNYPNIGESFRETRFLDSAILKMLAILTQVRKFSGRIGGDHPEEFWRRVKHPAERRENCWPASWRGSNYSNDRGRFRFSSSHPHRFAQKRFNCRNRFRWLRWDCAQRWCSHPFLISDTIFQNSHLTFLSCLLSSTQSCCRFN